MSDGEEKYLLARVLRPHGLRGGLKLEVEDWNLSHICEGIRVFCDEGKEYLLERVQKGNAVIAYLGDIEDRSAAEDFAPNTLWGLLKERKTFRGGGEDPVELINYEVFSFENRKEKVGVVKDFYQTKAHYVLIIEGPSTTVEIPLLKHFIPLIDKDQRQLFLRTLEYV